MSKRLEVDEYIARFSGEVQKRLIRMRELVLEVSPDAEETVSYGIVGYKRNAKPLVYFGGFEKHIGLYATPNGHEKFANEFAKYKQGKGSVQFPLNQPLPEDLIRHVVEYRVSQTEK